jgi:hypothetical protein
MRDTGCLSYLTVAFVQLRQTLLELDVVGVEVEDFLHHLDGQIGLVGLQIGLDEPHVVGASIGHHALHRVEVGQARQGVGVGGIKLGDLLVHGDPAHQEAFSRVEVGQPDVVLQGFGNPVQANVEIAQGVEDVLILHVLGEDLLVLVDRFLQLALRGQFLGDFD